MAGLLTNIVIKKYVIMEDDYSILNFADAESVVMFFPERKKFVRYVDIVEVGGTPHVLGSNAVLVSLDSLSMDEIRSLLGEDSGVFIQLEKENKPKKYSTPYI